VVIYLFNVDIVHSSDYSMVRSTYKALSKMKKGVVDTRPPETFKFIKKLSKNRRPNNFANVEHARNLKSLGGRINTIQKRSVSCIMTYRIYLRKSCIRIQRNHPYCLESLNKHLLEK